MMACSVVPGDILVSYAEGSKFYVLKACIVDSNFLSDLELQGCLLRVPLEWEPPTRFDDSDDSDDFEIGQRSIIDALLPLLKSGRVFDAISYLENFNQTKMV